MGGSIWKPTSCLLYQHNDLTQETCLQSILSEIWTVKQSSRCRRERRSGGAVDAEPRWGVWNWARFQGGGVDSAHGQWGKKRMEAKSEENQHRQLQLPVLPVHEDAQSSAAQQGVMQNQEQRAPGPDQRQSVSPIQGIGGLKERALINIEKRMSGACLI